MVCLTAIRYQMAHSLLPRTASYHEVSNNWRTLAGLGLLWRMVTAMFLTKVSFNFIISLYFRFQYSMFLETGVFAGREADYLYFILLSATLINALNYFAELAILWEAFSMAIVYVWSRHNAEVTVNFMFGFRFPAKFLPLVLGTMEFLFAGDLYGPLIGIVTGHAYYFLSEIYVAKDPSWRRRLTAPGWLKGMVPKPQAQTGSHTGFSVQAPYGGRGDPSKQAEIKPESYRAFAGKSQKLGTS